MCCSTLFWGFKYNNNIPNILLKHPRCWILSSETSLSALKKSNAWLSEVWYAQSWIFYYSSPVWDHYLTKDIQGLERVQRRAVHWVMSGLVSTMLNHLGWPTLAERHLFARLSTFYKIVCHLSAPQMPSYYPITNRLRCQYHLLHFVIPPARTNYCMNSFYPWTICDWNNLPTPIIESDSINEERKHSN